MKKYKLIGLTGQSGAGKSEVSAVFSECGATVLDADEIVAELYAEGSPCVRTVAAVFGADVLTSDGTLDRKLLAERAFSSKENTALLGRIVHPFVTARFFELLRDARGTVIYDAPQLFESGADVICDAVIAVVADKNVRLSRIMKRDGLPEKQARERIDAQLSEEYFRERSDYIIENNGDRTELREKAHRLRQIIETEVR